MENRIDLPPGFRFHPTDEELISHYLCKKVIDTNFTCKVIGEVDLNKSEPWDLPWKAKMGEKEWYFFCQRDRKYPTGLRTNRATASGYWKATGKDKEIYRGKTLVGMKKTLVFYGGRAPRGEKSNWVMHEFRLQAKLSPADLPNTTKNEWVISRVFQKGCGGKKVHISGLLHSSRPVDSVYPGSVHVPCFSNAIAMDSSQRTHPSMTDFPFTTSTPHFPGIFPRNKQPSSVYPQTMTIPFPSNLQFPGQRVSISQETELTSDMNNEISSGGRPFEDQEAPSASAGPLNSLIIWNY